MSVKSVGSARNSAPAETNVFISYSRRDGEAAGRLRERLIEHGFQAYLDKHDIAAGEDWRARLGTLIESADVVVFLVSPDSLSSKICDWEVNHAELTGKRIIPVVCSDPADEDVPERLRRLNYVFMRTAAEEADELPKLEAAIAVDIAWVREHTRYGELALQWDRAGSPDRLLLRGASIGEAEAWRDGRPSTAPELTALQSAYIAKSRSAAGRRQRYWIAGSAAVAIVSAGLAVFAFVQQRAAEASRQQTVEIQATSNFYQGSQLLENDATVADGVAFLAQAARRGDTRALARLWTMLQQRSFWIPDEASGASDQVVPAPDTELPTDIQERFANVEVDGQTLPTTSIALSGDSALVAATVGDGVTTGDVQVRVWRRDGTAVTDWFRPAYRGGFYVSDARPFLSHNGRYLAIEVQPWREAAYLLLYNLATMKSLPDLSATRPDSVEIYAGGLLPQVQFTRFNHVAFVDAPTRMDNRGTYLVTGSAKGRASAYAVSDDGFSEAAATDHRAPVVYATIDARGEWLMSAGADRTVRVHEIDGEAASLGHAIKASGRQVTRLERTRADALAIVTDDRTRERYRLLSPKTLVAADSPAEMEPEETCLARDAASTEGANAVLRHPSGLVITWVNERQLSAQRSDGRASTSPILPMDIGTVCASVSGDLISVSMVNFRTEIWTADFSRRLGPPIDEGRYFREGMTPEKTDWVKISADGTKALLRTSFWDPPNLNTIWISLWDIRNGLPLMDRSRFQDDSLTEGAIQSAAFDAQGSSLIFLSGKSPVRAIQIEPPAPVRAWLPQFAEAATGLRVSPEGLADQVVGRAPILAEGIALLDSLR